MVVALAFAALTFVSWRRWPDLLIDYGRELYVPWQMSLGKVLYVDIAYFNGPLSSYYHALLFGIYGVSMTVLIASSLLLAILIAGGFYASLARLFDPATAALGSITFLCGFALRQLSPAGSFNFICPYSYDLVHGVEISLLMLLLLGVHAERRHWAWGFGAGACLGLVFLTKAEVFLAALSAAAAWALLSRDAAAARTRFPRKAVAAFLAGAGLAVAAGFMILRLSMDASQAWRGILGTWHPLMTTGVAGTPFYRHIMGTIRPWINAAAMLKATLGLILLIASGALADVWSVRNERARWPLFSIMACLLVFFPLSPVEGMRKAWVLKGPVLPLFSLGILIVAVTRSVRLRLRGHSSTGPGTLAVCAAFAFALLAKIALNVSLWHYGFALAMPATILMVVTLIRLVPDLLNRLYGGGRLFRMAAMAAIVVDLANLQRVSSLYYHSKTAQVGRGGDGMLAYSSRVEPKAAAVNKALDWIESKVPPRARLLVLPEGVMLNYLSRRSSPIPYINILPPELAMYGEENILASMRKSPADYVLIVHREMRYYRTPYFGAGPSYGKRIMDWVRLNYATVRLIMEPPLKRPGHFGIEILQRRDPGASS